MKPASSASLFAVAVVGLTACSDAASSLTDGIDHRAPPSIDLRAKSADSGGVLKITVTMSNRTSVHLQVPTSPQCPFAVRIFPDSTGEFIVASGTGCTSTANTTDLAPGDSLALTRVFSATDLTQYAPGTYGINVTVGTNTETVTAWGGAVRLPLSSTP